MSPERWQRIEELFHAALEREESERAAFLVESCAGDDELRRAVESLLASQQNAEEFLETPALPALAKVLAEDPTRPRLTGQTVSRYVVLEELGGGGMGVVYKARDIHLGRFVALKFLPQVLSRDRQALERLKREARAASALNHPNIVHIYDIADSEGMSFLAMEYVEGRTLGELITRKGLALGVALKYAIQIADALTKAHGARIVHRDLKPSNIMVTGDGLVKVLDFGLAKMTEPAGGELANTRTMRSLEVLRTEEGVILGTAAYMSPEQAEGKPVDARSDIFSFGAVLYEMISGQRAFQADSRMATLARVINQEPPPLHEVSPAIPAEFERIVTRCLRKSAERRWQSMADLKVALEEVKDESESGSLAPMAAPARPPAPKKLRWWTLSAAFCLAAAGLFWFFQSSSNRESALQEVPLTSYSGSEDSPSFSPDGNQVAFSWNGEKQDNFDIYVKLIGPGAPLRLTTDPADDIDPAWSPDGRSIAFLRDFGAGKLGVFLIPALGGPERKLLDVFIPKTDWLTGPYLAWLPDSKGIIFTHQDSPEHPSCLYLLRMDNDEKRQLTFAPAGTLGDSSPALSPDGSTLIFVRATAVGPADLYTLPLRSGLTPSGAPRRITFFNWTMGGAAWTSNEREIVFSHEDRLWKIALSRFGGNPGKPRRLESIGANGSSPAISRHGGRLAYSVRSGGDWDIWRVAIPDWRKTNAPGTPEKFIASTWNEFAPQYSPDGRRIAFESTRSGNYEIWVCGNDGSNCVQLTSFNGPATGIPHWSPDGQYICFYSRVEDKAHIHVIRAEGGAPRRLTSGPSDNMFSNWSRDGKWIYFSSNRSGTDQIWKMAASGGTPVQVTRNGGFAAAESADGRHLYYTRSKDPDTSLWRMPVEGGPEVRVLESVVLINYAVTRSGLYFMCQPDPHAARKVIQFLSFSGPPAKIVASTDRDVYAGLAVSPDEHWLIYAQNQPENRDLMLVENFE